MTVSGSLPGPGPSCPRAMPVVRQNERTTSQKFHFVRELTNYLVFIRNESIYESTGRVVPLEGRWRQPATSSRKREGRRWPIDDCRRSRERSESARVEAQQAFLSCLTDSRMESRFGQTTFHSRQWRVR